MKFLINFLFGKSPQVFFLKDGSVRHKHSKKKWNDWHNRFSQNPNYNWRIHTGKVGKK